jgi:hypothetical protein
MEANSTNLSESLVPVAVLPAISILAEDDHAKETKNGIVANPGKFKLSRTGDISKALTAYFTIGGTATAGEDYQDLGTSVDFAPGSATADLQLVVNDDSDPEVLEDVTVDLAARADYTLDKDKSSATVKLFDNDDKFKFGNIGRGIVNLDRTTGLRFKLLTKLSDDINQIGVFLVDGIDGSIDGVNPDDVGYAKKVFSQGKAQVVFDTLGTFAPSFDPSLLERTTGFLPSNSKLGFFMRDRDGKYTFATQGKEDDGLSFSNTEESDLVMRWQGEDYAIAMSIEKNDAASALGTKHQGKVNSDGTLTGASLDLSEIVAPSVGVTFETYREADYSSHVGFYLAQDASGAIDSGKGVILKPGDAGYVQAALKQALKTDLQLSAADKGKAETKANLNKGIYLPIIASDNSLEGALGSNKFDRVYTAFANANADKQSHIALLGDNTFGFEDMVNGGDKDYNDIIVKTIIKPL